MNLRPKRRPVPMIPIVSLIDIMVILLIFTTVTTTFKKNKVQMQIALPESKTMGTSAPSTDTRVSITISKDQKVFLDAKPVDAEKLAAALTQLRATQPGVKLELEADTATSLGVLVKVWDALREAGVAINDVPARIQRK